MHFGLISLAVLAVFFVSEGEAIRCYYCTGFDQGCDDPFDGRRVAPPTDCTYRTRSNSGYPMQGSYNAYPNVCKKTVENNNGRRLVTRDCASQMDMMGLPSGQTCHTVGNTEICYCSYDSCNGAFNVRPSPVMALALIAVAIFGARKLL